MKITVITTWNNKLFDAYAHRFQSTYKWSFPLKIYNEDGGMFDEIPECKKFVERNKDRYKYTSYEEKTNDYRKDGVRFLNRLRIRPIYDDVGRLMYYAGVQNPIG